MSPAEHTRLTAIQRVLAIGLVLGVTLVAFEITAVITALPSIADELGGDSLYGASMAAYTLANLVSMVVAGELADRRGPAVPYAISIGVFVTGLVVAAAAPSMVWIVIGRALQGLGTGAFAPIAYSLVSRAFPADRQPMMFAYLSAGWVLPSLFAPAVAGWITDSFGWEWVFLGLVPAALAVGVLALRPMMQYPPIPGERMPTRVPAAFGAAMGIGAVVTGLQFAEWWAMVAAVVVGAAVALPALGRLFPRGVHVAASGLAAVIACRILATCTFGGVDAFVPLAADRVHGARPLVQGFVIIGAALTWTLGQWVRAKRPNQHPAKAVRQGFAVLVAGTVLTAPVLWHAWPLWATFIGWAVGGLGMGLLFNPTTVVAMSFAAPGREGEVSSQVTLADSVGFSLIGGIGGATVAAADRTSWSLTGAIGTNFAIAAALAVLGLFAATRIRAAGPTAA
ncbi:MAG TPA: MFS transporter [Ilumatobacteraceae bacterium]|nr:MFS transporter [Ilumatobacteraceae bacterium]